MVWAFTGVQQDGRTSLHDSWNGVGTMVVDIDHNFSRIARRAASDFEKFVVMLEEIM